MAFRYTSIGRAPAVYLLIASGSMICSGTSGTTSRASLSFGTPASISFNEVTASQAAKPAFAVNRMATSSRIGFMRIMSTSSR
uniref:Putative secreted protein n=1 Tax=Anopheles marajoara TaxID=58244 RepID=A0A2M4CB87_9DIPT